MKTTSTITQKDIIAFIAVIILFALMMPLKAANGKAANSESNANQTASKQLALFNKEIEQAVEFTAPALSEDFETVIAESTLEDVFTSLASIARYTSPSVNENLEVADALQNLDYLNNQIEESVKYTASVN